MGKYDHLMFEMFPEEAHWGDWCAKPQAYFRGESSMPGARYHVGFQVYNKSMDVEVPHFHHHAEEYLIFVGAGFPDIFDFDAEIELKIGYDPDHMESIFFNKPAIVRIPPNVWHCPIHMRLNKPILFQSAYLDGTWAKITRGKKLEGDGMFEYEYIYEGDNVRLCRLDPSKKCNICGACYANINADGYKEEDYK